MLDGGGWPKQHQAGDGLEGVLYGPLPAPAQVLQWQVGLLRFTPTCFSGLLWEKQETESWTLPVQKRQEKADGSSGFLPCCGPSHQFPAPFLLLSPSTSGLGSDVTSSKRLSLTATPPHLGN